MAPKKGTTNNPNGRPAGVPNKATASMRERVNNFLETNFEEVTEAFKKLSAPEKLTFYTKLLSFGLPTLKAVEHSGEIKNRLDSLSDDQVKDLVTKLLDEVEQ